MMEKRLSGTCQEFCPSKEVKLRRRERIVHKLENDKFGLQLVKEYSRPAAGQPPPQTRDIRTPDTLLACVRYLLRDVLLAGLADESLQDQTLYDFLFDRLRAVRQDLTLQTVADSVTLTVLASCVRFHLVFGLLLRSSPTFSEHLNSQHQLDCLKSCLLLSPASHQAEELTSLQCVYLLNNLDSDHAIVWALNNKQTSQPLERCYQLGLTYRAGNFVRYFRAVAELPLLLLLAVRRHCDLMLDRALTTSQAAYRSPNLKYPLSHLATLLWTDQVALAARLRRAAIKVDTDHVMFGLKTGEAEGKSEGEESCYSQYFRERLADQRRAGLDVLILGDSM